MREIVLAWTVAAVVLVVAGGSPALRSRSKGLHWYVIGFPATVIRMFITWHLVARVVHLSIAPRHTTVAVGRVAVAGEALRPRAPRLGLPRPVRGGLVVWVRMHPGQTPAPYLAAAEALEHAWRVHSVRVRSPRRGFMEITVIARDPLAEIDVPPRPVGLMAASVGKVETGEPWVIDLLDGAPHWLVVGATRSGKSTLLAAWVSQLARHPIGLLGIDCKGGMELSHFQARLSALAADRAQAADLLEKIVDELGRRMAACRAAGVRSVWEMPGRRPVPLVVVVDELAELYLSDGSRQGKQDAVRCSVALLRVAQLGAALGVHVIAAGQRISSDLGPGVTALRAQLGGRVCHAVHDNSTAEMALGDLHPDALDVVQAITRREQGTAVTTDDKRGGWVRVRSTLVTTGDAQATAAAFAYQAPYLAWL